MRKKPRTAAVTFAAAGELRQFNSTAPAHAVAVEQSSSIRVPAGTDGSSFVDPPTSAPPAAAYQTDSGGVGELGPAARAPSPGEDPVVDGDVQVPAPSRLEGTPMLAPAILGMSQLELQSGGLAAVGATASDGAEPVQRPHQGSTALASHQPGDTDVGATVAPESPCHCERQPCSSDTVQWSDLAEPIDTLAVCEPAEVGPIPAAVFLPGSASPLPVSPIKIDELATPLPRGTQLDHASNPTVASAAASPHGDTGNEADDWVPDATRFIEAPAQQADASMEVSESPDSGTGVLGDYDANLASERVIHGHTSGVGVLGGCDATPASESVVKGHTPTPHAHSDCAHPSSGDSADPRDVHTPQVATGGSPDDDDESPPNKISPESPGITAPPVADNVSLQTPMSESEHGPYTYRRSNDATESPPLTLQPPSGTVAAWSSGRPLRKSKPPRVPAQCSLTQLTLVDAAAPVPISARRSHSAKPPASTVRAPSCSLIDMLLQVGAATANTGRVTNVDAEPQRSAKKAPLQSGDDDMDVLRRDLFLDSFRQLTPAAST